MRQHYNRLIRDHLVQDNRFCNIITEVACADEEAFFDVLDNCIKDFPDQRFGQIICNYILPDYRSTEPGKGTKALMEFMFPGLPDPFYEESSVTYKRLNGENIVESPSYINLNVLDKSFKKSAGYKNLNNLEPGTTFYTVDFYHAGTDIAERTVKKITPVSGSQFRVGEFDIEFEDGSIERFLNGTRVEFPMKHGIQLLLYTVNKDFARQELGQHIFDIIQEKEEEIKRLTKEKEVFEKCLKKFKSK